MKNTLPAVGQEITAESILEMVRYTLTNEV